MRRIACETSGRQDAGLEPRRLLEGDLTWLVAYVRSRAGTLVRSRESCTDLAQSVCREVLEDEHALAFPSADAFRAFLLKAADRKIFERHRYHTRQKRDAARTEPLEPDGASAHMEDGERSPSESADLRERVRVLEQAFERLSPEYRDAIVLFHVAGLSHGEIGRQLGRSASASRNLLSRALARLAVLARTGT